MMLNKVILIGNLGRDPEVRYLPSGDAVANFSIATSENWKDRNGQRQERTEWHNISMFGRLAEIAGQYLKKGSKVYIEGRIQSRKYTGKDGIERTAYDIVANEMKMLDGRNSGSSPYEGGDQYVAAPSSPRQQSAQNYNEPAYAAVVGAAAAV
ncbi:single-stranded DNA-binding protein, partial [Eikenella corrodens]|uniref:single-stranded DNA-binding protein n=1 Tax=Eikenella corrodens TaxID=539 RepID=UPI00129A48EE